MGLPNTFPYEVMGSPFSLYVAAAATARPALDEVPGIDWTLLGSNGAKSYAEEGVTLMLPQSFNKFRGYGSAAPLKIFRSEEDVQCRVVLADMTLEQLANALNSNTVATTPHRKLGLSRGLTVSTIALLARGPSPYADNKYSQIWIPYAANVSSPELPFRRDTATIYTLQWDAIVNPDAASDDEQLGVIEALDEDDVS